MYVITKDGAIYDLKSKEVSSWEYIDNDTAINEYGVECAFYTIYYFDENKGHYSEYDGKGGHSCDFIEEKDILKQSENLEELCDEGVIEVKFSSTGYIAHFNKNIDELRKFLKYLEECQPITKDEILNVYGAIYTSKGLIYVAKMDNDGKLVLI